MSNNDSLDVLNLPPRIYNPGFEPNIGAVVIQHFETHLVKKVELALGEEQFNLIKASFLGPIIELAKRSGVNFSGKIFHFLMQRRLLLKEKNLWFTFDSQPMRFSEREFLLTTGVQCDLIDSEMLRKGKAPSKAPYFWTQKEHFTLEQLQKRLFEPNQLHPLDAEEKLSLGMVILTEAFLFTPGSLEKIPLSRLVHASEFAIYTSQPWGKHAYRVLATSIQRINENTWARGTYEVKGFAMAILLWAFSAVPSLGSAFATECVTSRSEYPLCLKWETTQTPRFSHLVDVVKKMNSVKVNTVIGNPYEYSYLVASSHEDDIDFEEIVRLVQKGYRLKATDWSAGFIDIFTVLQEIGEQTMNNNLSDSQKLDKILNLLQDFNRRIAVIEYVLKSRLEKDETERCKKKESNIQEETCARTEEQSDKAGPNIDGDIGVDGDSREGDECGPSRDGEIDVDGDNKEDDECGPSTFEDSIREPNTEDGSYAGDDENSQKIRSEDDTTEPTAKDKEKEGISVSETNNEACKKSSESKKYCRKKRYVRERKETNKRKQGDNSYNDIPTRKQPQRKKCKNTDKVAADLGTRTCDQELGDKADNDVPLKTSQQDVDNKSKADGPSRRSQRSQVPSIYSQPPYTAEKKKHPTLHPFAKVDTKRVLTVGGIKVDSKWFTTLETQGKPISGSHVDAALHLIKTRRENHPEMYLNKTVVFVGSSFLNAIDDEYAEFVVAKDDFQFSSEEISKLEIGSKTNHIYAPMCLKGKCWVPVVINIERRSLIILDYATSFVSENVKRMHVVAYSVAMPYILRKLLNKTDMDVSAFKISVVDNISQAEKIEDTGMDLFLITAGPSLSSEKNNGLPLGDDASQSQSRRKKRKKEDTWMKDGLSLKDLLKTLSTKRDEMDDDERVRLGALILVEGILIASNPVNKIEKEHLQRASSFTEFCKYPWARIVYGSLVDCLKKITPTQLFRNQCGLPGFVFAIQIWALTAVAELGQNFGSRVLEPNDNRPLISQWMTTKCPTKKEIAKVTKVATFDIKHIIGDPEQYSHLVLPPNPEDKDWFEVFDLVVQGYRMTRQQWIHGWIELAEWKMQKPVNQPRQRQPKSETVNQTKPRKSMSYSEILELIYKSCLELNKRMLVVEKHLGIKAPDARDDEGKEFPASSSGVNKKTEEEFIIVSDDEEEVEIPINNQENKQTETREESCSPPDEDSHENVNDENVAQEEGATDEVPHATEESDPQCSNVNDKVSQKKEKQHEEMRNMDGAPQGTQESDSQRSNVNDKVAQTEEAQHNKMGHSEEPSQESDSQQSKVNDKEEEARLKKEHSDRKLSDIEQKEIDDRVILWAKNKNFIFMISSLHQIIWSNSSWETVHHFNLVNNDNEIGLAKRKALLALHPDKQHGASAEQKYLATRLFSVIKHEWDIYIRKKQV
ncbi:unnamed protein product [Arabidopsis arenosa]|uniref:Ubiquitin-like protease family profile domain-containing protein n=1 Tax=Arabidopsis arenosa TaxID=38785 RepID=A0A8S1ZN38_ARAAE|nr:unnamed protein product [Arabidopsis arenosa]